MQASKRVFLCAGWLSFFLASSLFAGGVSGPIPVGDEKSPIITNFVFDSSVKYYDAKLGEESASFKFIVTNLWTNEITVDRMETSCGCTVAKMPAYPWHIPAGGSGPVDATINLKGKGSGQITKLVTLYLSADTKYIGTRIATLKVNVPAEPVAPGPAAMTEAQRKVAMEKAKADPQEIFKNSQCAECHVKKGINKMADALYAADCGICHDSPNRASSVPDLHALKVTTNPAYWKNIVANGKPNTMMPAFADTKGGPLNVDQVHSLAEYLSRMYPSHAASAQ